MPEHPQGEQTTHRFLGKALGHHLSNHHQNPDQAEENMGRVHLSQHHECRHAAAAGKGNTHGIQMTHVTNIQNQENHTQHKSCQHTVDQAALVFVLQGIHTETISQNTQKQGDGLGKGVPGFDEFSRGRPTEITMLITQHPISGKQCREQHTVAEQVQKISQGAGGNHIMGMMMGIPQFRFFGINRTGM